MPNDAYRPWDSVELVRRWHAHLAEVARQALGTYAAEVRSGSFPAEMHGYRISAEELAPF